MDDMNPREAILAAADQISRHPNTFRFSSIEIPRNGRQGCALGWIGEFGNVPTPYPGWRHLGSIAQYAGARDTQQFYHRLDWLVTPLWQFSAHLCAWGLRRYANKYHPSLRKGRDFLNAQPERAVAT